MNILPFTEDCIPAEIRASLEKLPLRVRGSFIAILENTWRRQHNNKII